MVYDRDQVGNCKVYWTAAKIQEFNANVEDELEKYPTSYDGLIYFVSCYQIEENRILDTYGKIYNLSHMISCFNNKSCQALRNKPKIFIFDSSKGEQTESKLKQNIFHLRNENDDSYDEKKESTAAVSSKAIAKSINSPRMSSNEIDEQVAMRMKVGNKEHYYRFSDNYTIYSSVDGYVSYGDDKVGSFLIHSFCKAAKSGMNKRDNSLQEMALQSQNLVQSQMDASKNSQYRQTIETSSTIGGTVVFRQKVTNTAVTTTKQVKTSAPKTPAPAASTASAAPMKARSLSPVPIWLWENPLVVVLCVDNNPIESRKKNRGRFIQDYMNIKWVFNQIRRYSIVYQTSDNKIRYIETCAKSADEIGDRFKLTWDTKEIRHFNDNVKSILDNDNHNYDGFIYFVSYCSNKDGLIAINDARDTTYPIATLIDSFSNAKFAKLRGKPKIFVLDGDRGPTKEKKQKNIKKKNETKNEEKNEENSTKQNAPKNTLQENVMLKTIKFSNTLTTTLNANQKASLDKLKLEAKRRNIDHFSKNGDAMIVFSTLK